jgi:hypothetical protein
MDIFRKIAEERIREAMENGLFDDLPGKGRPIHLEDETWIPEDLRIAYRLLKKANFLPPELELRKEIVNLRSLIDTIDNDKERLRKLRELNFKIMRLNLIRERPMRLDDECRIIEGLLA